LQLNSIIDWSLKSRHSCKTHQTFTVGQKYAVL